MWLKKIYGMCYTQILVPLQLSDGTTSLNRHDEELIMGFISFPNPLRLKYIAPNSLNQDFHAIKKCLDKGKSLVSSIGEVLNIGELIPASCPTAKGMSGSPLFKKTPSGYIVVGVLFGGPASLIHYCTAHLIHCEDIARNPVSQQLSNYLEQNIKWSMKTLGICNELDQSTLLNYLPAPTHGLQLLYSKAVKYESKLGRFTNYNNFQLISSLFSDIQQTLSSYN